MNKITKKLLPILFVVPMVSACSMYSADEVEKEEMVGVYKLTTITKNHNKKEDPYDYKAEKGIEAWFSLDIDGNVYYAYKDNSTALKMTQAFAIYHLDIIETELYDSISITDGVSDFVTAAKEVGCMDEPQMGFKYDGKNKRKRKATFSYTIPFEDKEYWNGIIKIKQEYQYVCYERISETGTLGELNKILGTNYSFARPFDMLKSRGFYSYQAQKKESQGVYNPTYGNDDYEYMIIDMESYKDGKADLYYSEVANPGQKKGSATFTFTPSLESFNTITINVLGKDFSCFRSTVGLSPDYYSDGAIWNEEDTYVSQSLYQVLDETHTLQEVLETIGFGE